MDYENRCPWCGAVDKTEEDYAVKVEAERFELPPDRFSARCGNCNRWGHKKIYLSVSGFLIVSFVLLLNHLGTGSFGTWDCILMLFLYFLFKIQSKSPEVRRLNGRWYERLPDELPHYMVRIDWMPFAETGFFLVKERIWNDYILPICFVDEQKKAASSVWCVKIDGIRRYRGYSTGRINFLLEEAPESLMEEGSHFFVFNRRQKIGEGCILHRSIETGF